MRRRRTKYTWFPVLGTAVDGGVTGNETLPGFPFTVGSPITEGAGDPLITPLIPDREPDVPTTSDENLVDFLGSDYIVKRIVGKIYGFASAAAGTSPPIILFAAGIFVARANESNPNEAIGASTAAERVLNYGPLDVSNIREPWMWRRTWVLKNSNSNGAFTGAGLDSTYHAGSVMDGPHIDVKVSRRVRNDERLWMALQAATILIDGASTPASVDGFVDYRVLGALRKAKNRSAF